MNHLHSCVCAGSMFLRPMNESGTPTRQPKGANIAIGHLCAIVKRMQSPWLIIKKHTTWTII